MAAAVRARHRTRSSQTVPNSGVAERASKREGRIETRRLADLKPHPKDLRKHSEKQLAKLTASIAAFGFNSLIVIDGSDTIIAGHARCEAAKRAGYEETQVLVAAHLTPSQLRAFRIADNRIAEDGEWNREVLRIELADLSMPDIEFNVELTGFDTADIDSILEERADVSSDTPEELPPLRAIAVSRPGDLWQMGGHYLLCGDGLAPASYARLLGDKKARLIVADPPYNVPVDGHVSGLGRVKHREFAMASGEMSRSQFTQFLSTAFTRLVENSVDGSLHYHFMDHRHIEEIVAAGGQAYSERKNVLVWVKTNAGMGSFYRSQHELIFVYKHGSAPHVNNVQLGATGRYRANVMEYAGANSFGSARDEDLARHPTSKPVALIADLIRDASKVGEWVLDCFAGGGTIFVAAERTRRRAAGIEIDPIYCDLAIERWQKATGKTAVLVDTGEEFQAVAEARLPISPIPQETTLGAAHGA
jgi:DNA modification methylase